MPTLGVLASGSKNGADACGSPLNGVTQTLALQWDSVQTCLRSAELDNRQPFPRLTGLADRRCRTDREILQAADGPVRYE